MCLDLHSFNSILNTTLNNFLALWRVFPCTTTFPCLLVIKGSFMGEVLMALTNMHSNLRSNASFGLCIMFKKNLSVEFYKLLWKEIPCKATTLTPHPCISFFLCRVSPGCTLKESSSWVNPHPRFVAQSVEGHSLLIIGLQYYSRIILGATGKTNNFENKRTFTELATCYYYMATSSGISVWVCGLLSGPCTAKSNCWVNRWVNCRF